MMKSFFAEWKELITNKKVLIPVIAVLMIPLLYSGMFLWAFWDPYDKLDELPVAVVNLDQGAEYDESSLAIGEDLTENLKDNDGFLWEFVSKEEANKGLEQQRYYMVVEIPADFSERATTLLEENPSALELKYIPNESYNFLSSQIGSTAIEKIKEEVSRELIKTYAETMFTSIETMANGYREAADGTNKLNAGVDELHDGSKSLMQGLEQAAEKSIMFSNGVSTAFKGAEEVYSGNKELAIGLQQLLEGHGELENGADKALAGTEKLTEGLLASEKGLNQALSAQKDLANGADSIMNGAGQLSIGASELQAGAAQAVEQAEKLSNGMKQLQQVLQPFLEQVDEQQKAVIEATLQELAAGSAQFSQGIAGLENGAGQIQTGSATLESKLQQLAIGQKQVANGLAELVDGAGQLSAGSSELVDGQTQLAEGLTFFGDKLAEATQGSKQLAQGSEQLVTGMQELDNGSKQFQSGTAELADGSGRLQSGISEVGEGTQELEEKLTEASEKAGTVKGKDETYDMFSEPVKVQSEVLNGVPNYGTGFAPYFLSLGLFVGALLLSIVFPLREPAGTPSSGSGWFFGKVGVLAAVGILQALLADAVLLLGLGVEVKSVPLFIAFSVITSFTFIALVQFLVTILGHPGRFVAILILILQLTTSAGTFPLELIPDALQPFNLFLPMTYSVSGFKAVISSGDFGFMWKNSYILAGFLTATLLGTWAYFVAKFKKEYHIIEE